MQTRNLTNAIPDYAIVTESDREAIRQGCYWDDEESRKILAFTSAFFTSQFIKGRVRLCEEQKQFLRRVYGWRLPNGNRRFRFVNLHVPKKSFGKTLLVCIIAYYELLGAGEPSPFVVSCSASKENASQVYKELRYSLERSPFKDFTRRLDHTKAIHVKDTNATFTSLASDGKRLHGYNCSVAICDEAGWTANAEAFDALRYACDARANGMMIVISTASDTQEHWYAKRVYAKSKRVLANEDLDITHLAVIYEMDKDGNPEDPEQWHKANPLLGNHWCPLDRFKRDLEAAKASGLGEWLNFLRLKLGKWVAADELVYFELSGFDSLRHQPDAEELAEAPASIGVDLSEVCDPSSVTITWELSQGRYYSRSFCWVAEKGVKDREQSRDKERKYQEFIAEGCMSQTQGDMIDERLILNHLIELCQTYNIVSANFDPRSAFVLAKRLAEETGVKCERIPPSARYFNPAMVEMRKAIEEKRYLHDGSSWLKFCLENTRVEVNRYSEVAPVRKRSVDKIDGTISACLSLLGLLAEKAKPQSEITWGS